MRLQQTVKQKRRLRDAPKPVRDRWMRIKALNWAHKIARACMRWILPIAERQRRKALEQTFQTVKHYAIKSENGRFRGSSILFNIGLYLLIADRDIQAIKLNALTHPDEWTRKLNARIILITIYEWDADKVSGRAFKETLDVMMIPDDLKARAIEVLRSLRLVQRKVTKHFSFIRNATIGHRDANALAQYRAIRNLRVEDVMAIAGEFFAAIEEFVDVLTQIMLASSSFNSYLRQWIESEKPSSPA